jgi:Ca2+-binding EF-hand superfamily protein
MKRLIISYLALALPLATSTNAEVLEEFTLEEFAAADHDGSGCVDAEEFRNIGVLVFHSWDDNADGTLNGEELFGGWVENENVPVPAVTTADYQAELRRSHKLADKDGNGCLNEEEWGASR